MGEVDTAPEVAAKAIEDLTALEVDPDKCERLIRRRWFNPAPA